MPPLHRDRRVLIGAAAGAALVLLLLLILAAFPWGVLKGPIERRLVARFGPGVTIGALERADTIGLVPTLVARDVRVPQPAWAGSGDFARVRALRIRFPAVPLLAGNFRPREIVLDGARLALVRTADRRENWRERRGGKGAPLDLAALTVRDSIVTYRDAVQRRSSVLRIESDARGFRARGRGDIAGAAIIIAMNGAPIAQRGRWPFTASIDGPALAMTARGTMARPLDTAHMALALTARAADLKLIDAVIEAGLFGTRPVRLTADVRHDGPRWIVRDLRGTIGSSPLAGQLDVVKQDGRTRLDGSVRFARLDFEDLATPASTAAARAKERAEGLKLVPDTRINLAKIDKTDGRVALRIDRIVSARRPQSLISARATFALDHQRLEVPLTIGLERGTVKGVVTVTQGGQPEPRADVDLRLAGSALETLAGDGGPVNGRVDARARLSGRGATLREAVGRSSGDIGLVARDGELPGQYAGALGFDVGRALLEGKVRAGLRCVVIGLALRGGTARTDPFVVDTSQSRLTGTGTIRFPSEAVAIRLAGQPKQRSILHLPGTVLLAGTIRQPKLTIPPEVKSAGNIFKAIGRAIRGDQVALASDADCGALAARALR